MNLASGMQKYNQRKESYYTVLGFDMGVIALIWCQANAQEWNLIHVEFGAPPWQMNTQPQMYDC